VRLHEVKLGDIPQATIHPFSDLHPGELTTDLDEWEAWWYGILSRENEYLLYLGDNNNNATKTSKSALHTNRFKTPGEEWRWLKPHLRAAVDKGRIKLIVPGNHEGRDEDRFNYVQEFAEDHDIPYEEDAGFLKITLGKDRRHSKPIAYTFAAWHGWAGGRKPGNKINAMEDVGASINADVVIGAHGHTKASHAAMRYYIDPQNNRVTEVPQLIVCTSAWMRWGGYGLRKGYKPQCRGDVPILLSGKEKLAVAAVCGQPDVRVAFV
jgi:hypothetical protein